MKAPLEKIIRIIKYSLIIVVIIVIVDEDNDKKNNIEHDHECINNNTLF